MIFAPGQPAPEAELYRADGSRVKLSSYWQTRPLVLTFLRHFGCQFCREFLTRLRAAYPEFVERNIAVMAVAQGSVPQSAHFGQVFHIPFPLLSDPQRAAFQAYGLHEATVQETIGGDVPWQMVRAAVRGTLPGMRDHIRAARSSDGSSLRQLGGTFIIEGGVFRYISIATPIYKSPTIEELFAVLEQPMHAEIIAT